MKIIIETAKDGHRVPVIDRDGAQIHLGSMYDGRHAASEWCDYNLSEEKENMILVGLGDCQIALEARERLKEHLYIYEPCKEIMDKMKTTPLFKKLQKLNITEISGDRDRIETWINTIFNEDSYETMAFFVHPGYLQPEWSDVVEEIREFSKKKAGELIGFRASMLTIADSLVGNILLNIPKMKGCILLSRLQKKWDPRVPCIIVGAGPSLDKNVENLKSVGNKACIICLDSAYPVLIEHDIRPHMVCTVDVTKPLEVFGDPNSFDIPLVVIGSSNPDVLDLSRGDLIWCTESNQFTMSIRGRIGGDESLFPLEYGVSSMGIATAISLGASQIVYIGMDLAYSEDKRSHAGVLHDEFEKDDECIVEGYYGGVVYSRGDWMQMKKWMEAIAKNDNWGRFIDATEGGAKIEGMPQMTLEKVVSYLKEPEEDWTTVFDDRSVHISTEEYDEMMKRYYSSLDEFERMKDISYEGVFYQEKSKDMVAFQLLRGLMKSQPENTRRERFESAKRLLLELIKKVKGELDEKSN